MFSDWPNRTFGQIFHYKFYKFLECIFNPCSSPHVLGDISILSYTFWSTALPSWKVNMSIWLAFWSWWVYHYPWLTPWTYPLSTLFDIWRCRPWVAWFENQEITSTLHWINDLVINQIQSVINHWIISFSHSRRFTLHPHVTRWFGEFDF